MTGSDVSPEVEEALKDLREEVSELADESREGVDDVSLEQAKASMHGKADAYEYVTHLIDRRLYDE